MEYAAHADHHCRRLIRRGELLSPLPRAAAVAASPARAGRPAEAPPVSPLVVTDGTLVLAVLVIVQSANVPGPWSRARVALVRLSTFAASWIIVGAAGWTVIGAL